MIFTGETSVYDYLMKVREEKGAGFFVLMDPDRLSSGLVVKQAVQFAEAGVDAFLIGSSLMMNSGFDEYVEAISEVVDIPVIIFPAEGSHVTDRADAIFFLSLLSGRNPDLIIGEQVKSAPLIKNLGIEAISTAYLLVDSGRITSVEFISNTKPLPADKPEIALAHAMAAEIFGMKFVYLEAGSGALSPVPDDMISAVSGGVDLPVIVGGGIRNPETVAQKVAAGASFIVVGNYLEKSAHHRDIEDLINAAHTKV